MKRFKKKKRFPIKIILIILVLIVVLSRIKINYSLNKEEPVVVEFFLNDTNHYIKNDTLLSKIMDCIFNIDNPFYSVNSKKVVSNNFMPSKDVLVYIYSTHDKEKYMDNKGVIDASNLLKEKLDNMGIPTIVEKESVSNSLSLLGLDFYKSYSISRKFVEEAIQNYPNLKLIIDLHRDSVDHKYSYININGKDYARVLFVQGTRYDYENNLKLANMLSDSIKNKYPNLSKGIMMKDKIYQNPNFNQDLNNNAILLELGSNNNSWEEVSNTIEVISPIIKEVIYEKESN